MTHLKALFTRALLALALATGAGAALAGPTYHVAVDTSALAGTAGFLDLNFLGLGDAAPATATLSHFSGAFGGSLLPSGNVSGDLGSTIVFGNGGSWNDLLVAAAFGGLFGFDVSFDVADGSVGTNFGVALINEALDAYVGVEGDIADIALMPGAPDVVSPANAFASVSVLAADVPEPADWLLVATGLVLLGLSMQRRARR